MPKLSQRVTVPVQVLSIEYDPERDRKAGENPETKVLFPVILP